MNNISIEKYQNEQVNQVLDLLKKAVDAAHETSKFRMNTANIQSALDSNDYDKCFAVAQKGLKKYRELINSISMFTNIRVYETTEEEARKNDIDYWKYVLNFLKMIIFVNLAGEIISKSKVRDMIKETFCENTYN